jgi:WD40 repeat protein
LDAPARSIALWKSEAKTELPVFPVVSFTNDGTRLACADSSGEIRLWSLSGDEPRLIRSLKGRERPLQIAFDPAARFLAAVVESAGVIELWDLDAPPDAEPRTLTSSAYRVAFDSRGRWMASTDRTGSLASIWPLSRRFPFRLDRSGAEDLDFSADSAWLIATRPVQGVSRTPLRPSIATRGDRLTGPNSWGAAADHTGRRILVGGEGRAAIFQGGTETQLPTSAGHALFANAFSFDGKLAAAGTQDFGGHGGEIWLWNLESGERRVLKAAQAKDDVFNQTIWDLEFLRDGNLLSGGAGEVRLWNLHSGTSRQIARAEGEVHMDLTADERNLLVVATTQNRREGETTLINMKTNVARRLISHSHAASGALDPSGKFVVTWSANEPVGRISSLAGEDAHLLISGNGNGEGGRSEVAVSPDGKWIASSDGTGTRLWPTPDLSQRPFQTLPFDALMAKLRQQTNMRVVADKSQRSGYRIDIGELPSWKTAPTW